MNRAWLAAALLLSGCSDSGAELSLYVRTDLSPGTEFGGVVTWVDGQSVAEKVAVAGDDYVDGVLVARVGGLGPGTKEVRLDLVGAQGNPVLSRTTLVPLATDTAITLLFARRCIGVTCESPDAPACLGGECVPESCRDGTEQECEVEEMCATNEECPAPQHECAEARCINGTCLSPLHDELCGDSEVCRALEGCVPVPSLTPPDPLDAAMPDSGSEDAGSPDAGPPDAGPPDAGPADASASDTGQMDAGSSSSGPCTQYSTWAEPTRLDGPSSARDDNDVSISADGLELLFVQRMTDTPVDYDIYISRRDTRDQEFGPGVSLNFNSPDESDTGPSLSPDGLTLFFSSSRTPNGSDYDFLHLATRATTVADFGDIEVVYSDLVHQSQISHDGLALYFTRPFITPYFSLHRSGLAESFSTTPAFSHSLGISTCCPASVQVSADGLEIFLDLAGSLMTARRLSPLASFPTPQPIAELNTLNDNHGPHVTEDGLEMYFSSTRAPSQGYDIWHTTRTCLDLF